MLARHLIVLLAVLSSTIVHAQRSIEELLPASTAAVLKVNDVRQFIEDLLEHPLANLAKDAGAYDESITDEQQAQLDAVKTQIKTTLGLEWNEAIDELTSGGVIVAFDAATEGAIVIVQGENDTIDKVFEILLTNLKPLAALGGNPVNEGIYRDTITGYQIADIRFAVHEGTFVITNSRDLGRTTLNSLLGDLPSESLATNDAYKQAIDSTDPNEHTLWFWADSKLTDKDGGIAQLDHSMKDNMLAELLFGGITNQLRNSEYLTATLDFSKEQLRLALRTAHNHQWVPEKRYYYFGEDGKGTAPALLQPEGTLASLSMYRELAPWYLLGPDLYSAQVNEGIARADSQLSNFLGGKDFGEDILGALEPGFQLVVADHEFKDGEPVPGIKVPGFALVSKLQDPEVLKPELRRQFISFVGFLNLISGMEGGNQLDVDIQNNNGNILLTTAFLKPQPNQPVSIHYNFTPTLILTDDLFILSSTKLLAETLRDEKPLKRRNASNHTINTQFQLFGSTIQNVLEKNRGILITQNMLDKGASREQAVAEVDLTLDATELLQLLELKLEHTDSELTFSIELSFKVK